MNLRTPLLTALLCLPLIACGDRPSADAPAGETTLGQKVREATNEARKQLAEGNISVSSDSGAKVEISPKGDLLINDVAVTLDDKQRALLMQYRGQVVAVAEAGIEIGVQGANLGARAAGEAIKGILSGNTDKIEDRVNAEAEQIKASAAKLCDQLPAMLATQQQLAAAVPEFKPYATMDQSDIDDCRDNGNMKLP
ncbi:DUF2884 family protein [Stenotrophomonas sp. SY1]|jgi:hypothetical protein|uniref:DUF2884 family protein n=1 Tax=Stenotrophomonas sp. SY1 TaxID=477235 RepID=UPI001E370F08|nr:DUF2884 family protein [Stenotrophomonas sp. SY1]MCD9086702.1 YggN family protein [Stenotrophomonas sp. SY1]